MGGVDTARSLFDRNGLSSIILDVLIDSQPVTARQIYFKLKKKYGISITYQGVHKKLKSLESDGLLIKDSREYCINTDWLDRLELYISSLRSKLQQRNVVQSDDVVSAPDRIKVISFDLNGAIFTSNFDEFLLRHEIPFAYAAKYGLSMEEAFERVTTEYRNSWRKVIGWRDPKFWLREFDLDVSFDDISEKNEGRIEAYIDAGPVLKDLSMNYTLILISHAHDCVVRKKLDSSGLGRYFHKIFSVGSDFHKLIKDADVYRDICQELRIQPSEMVHVGNDFELDYKLPSSLGIRSFFIDRVGRREEPFVVRDLLQFSSRVHDLERFQ